MKEENAPAQPADLDLPPEVHADLYLLETEKALQNNDAQTAKTAFQKIEALNIEELPPDFFFLYGKFLAENCNVANLAKAVENGQVQNFLDDLLKARSFLKQFLTQAERTAAKEFEELQKFKNKRAGETFLIHLAACYTGLVNTIVGAEEYASSARIQVTSYYSEVVSSLLNAATDVHAKNDDGETPLHNAAEKGQVEFAKALLVAGADASAKNDGGQTPLYESVTRKDQVQTVEALLTADSDVNAKDKCDRMPLDITIYKNGGNPS